MSLPPLNVQIGAETDGLERGLGRARRTIRNFSLAAVAGLAAVTTGLAAMTTQGLAAVDAQAKLARSMDGTVNGLRAVQLAGKDAGVSVQEAGQALQRMARELARAEEEGGPAADALARLGLNARDLNRMDADRRLAAIADAAKAAGLSAGQASQLLRDLGVRSREMALLVSQGGDAIREAREEVREFGLELSQSQTEAVERANDAISRLRLVFESLSQQLAVNVAPVLQRVAQSFNDFAKSDAARQAVERIATSFGTLAEAMLRPETVDAVASALSGLMTVIEGVTNAMVFLAQNVEIATAAFSIAAVGIAALGGPLTLIIGALGAAALGFSAMRARAEETRQPLSDFERAVNASEQAQVALNSAMGDFHETRAPASARESVKYARQLRTQAQNALAAAEAELALLQAEQARRQEMMREPEGRMALGLEALSGRDRSPADVLAGEVEEAQERVERASQGVAEAIAKARRAVSDVTSAGIGYHSFEAPGEGGGSGGVGAGDAEDIGGGGGDIAPGLAGAEKLDGQLQARLDMLQQGLMTEREAAEAAFDQGMETLRDAREAELLTEQEYREAKENLEKQHQERMASLRDTERRAAMQGMKGMFGDLTTLMRTENERLFKIGQAAAIANAVVKGYEAAVDAWGMGMKIGGPPLAAAFTAASLARTGALISQIASQSPQGTSSGGGSRGGGGSAVAQTSERPQIMQVQIEGERIGTDTIDSLFDRINEGLQDGRRLKGIERI